MLFIYFNTFGLGQHTAFYLKIAAGHCALCKAETLHSICPAALLLLALMA
jgi:hypothetical protein